MSSAVVPMPPARTTFPEPAWPARILGIVGLVGSPVTIANLTTSAP
jgi:hypothetical protein